MKNDQIIENAQAVIHPLAFSLKTASAATGLSPRTLRRLVKRGLLKPSRASRRFIFSRVEIERFLAETTAE